MRDAEHEEGKEMPELQDGVNEIYHQQSIHRVREGDGIKAVTPPVSILVKMARKEKRGNIFRTLVGKFGLLKDKVIQWRAGKNPNRKDKYA